MHRNMAIVEINWRFEENRLYLYLGKVHATDYSNISATGLWDPYINNWNDLCIKVKNIQNI